MKKYTHINNLGTKILSTSLFIAIGVLIFSGMLSLVNAGALDGDHFQDASGANTSVSSQVVRKGWGFMPGNGLFAIEDTPINYGITFDELPFLIVKFANSRQIADGDPANLSECEITRKVIAAGVNQTNSGFKPILRTPTGLGFPSTTNYCYTWIAIGRHDASYDGGDTDWTNETSPADFIRAQAGGIATNEATLYGISADTHINLGFSNSVTGADGLNNLYSTVGGGAENTASGDSATISGGYGNTASSFYGTIGGGFTNNAYSDASTVGGGMSNNANGLASTISGGHTNRTNAHYASIGGGYKNEIWGDRSAIPGGSLLKVGERSFGFRGGIGIDPVSLTDVSGEDNTFHIVDTHFHFNYSNANADFRIDGDTNDNILFVDASTDSVGIGTQTPSELLTVNGVVESSTGGFKFPDGTVQTSAVGFSEIKQLVQDFVVASGESVTAGDVVSLFNGKVQKGLVEDDNITFSPEYVFDPEFTTHASAAKFSDTKFVIAFSSGFDGKVIAGKILGNEIIYGSIYMFTDNHAVNMSVTALSSEKCIIAYTDAPNSNRGTAISLRVFDSLVIWSGDTYVFDSNDVDDISVDTLTSTQFVLTYNDKTSSIGKAIIGSNNVAGEAITYGSKYIFNLASSEFTSTTALSPTKAVISYKDGNNSDYGTSIIGNISGTIISFGSEYVFTTGTIGYDIDSAKLSSSKFVVISNHGEAFVGDVTGDTIAYGVGYQFTTGAYDTSVDALSPYKIVISFNDFDIEGKSVIAYISGSTITLGTEVTFNNRLINSASGTVPVVGLSENKFIVVYTVGTGSGTATIGKMLNNLVGIAKESKTSGEAAQVVIDGISDTHTGLTAGEIYYSDDAGDLTTEGTEYKIGLAISPTEILLDSNQNNSNQHFGDMIFANNFRITEAVDYEGLILMNQLNRGILSISEEGNLAVQGNLSLQGFMKLNKQSAEPTICSEGSSGTIALTTDFRTCVCNGTGWVYTSDGSTSCTW